MREVWHFECSCPLCVAERVDSEATRNERSRLRSEAMAFLARHKLQGRQMDHFTPTIVSEANLLLERILATYDSARYVRLPSLAAPGMTHWLVENAWATFGIDPRPMHAHTQKHDEVLG